MASTELGNLVESQLIALDARLARLEGPGGAGGAEAEGGGTEYTEEQINDLQQAFDTFDTDGSGSLSPGEFDAVFKLLGEPKTAEELKGIADAADENHNGQVDFVEFARLCEQYNILAEPEEGESEDDIMRREKKKLKKMSHYGRDVLLRWITDDGEEIGGDVTGPGVPGYRRLARRIMLNRLSENFIYVVISLAAVVSGLQTARAIHGHPVMTVIENVILGIFVVEMLIKFIAEGSGKFHHYFKDGWNCFDFTVLAVLIAALVLAGHSDEFDALRLLRLLRAVRVLKATRVLPRLSLVVEALIASASSVAYVALFLALISYIFAIIGVSTFRLNDPWHFGSLEMALLTLFRISTLEDWSDIMYYNMFGCDKWGDYAGDTGCTKALPEKCCEPEAFGIGAVLYFVVFVMISSFLLVNLFIGVITSAMADAKVEMYRRKKEQAKLAVTSRMRGKKKRQEAEADGGASEVSTADAADSKTTQNPLLDLEDDEVVQTE